MAPLLAVVALAAVGALVDGVPAGGAPGCRDRAHGAWRGGWVASPPGGLAACIGAPAAPPGRGEWPAAGRAGGGCVVTAVVTRRAMVVTPRLGGRDAAEVAVFEPVAVAFEGDDLGVVDEAVDHGGGDDVVAEDLAPAAERLVAGDDQAGPFVAGGDELEEQVRGFGLERDVADLVDDQQRVAAEADEFGLQPAGVVGVGEPGDPFGGGGEQRPGARPGRPGSPARSPGGSCRCRVGRGRPRSPWR